jgi:hypothetical protein
MNRGVEKDDREEEAKEEEEKNKTEWIFGRDCQTVGVSKRAGAVIIGPQAKCPRCGAEESRAD